MIYSVHISEKAGTDMHNIFDYIAYSLNSFQTAVSMLGLLEKEILSLEQMPERYGRYEKEPWFSRGLRAMPVKNYCVLYYSDRDTQIVDIVRVLYGKRNIETELNS